MFILKPTNIPLGLILVLCGISFLAGRYVQQAGELPEPTTAAGSRRKLALQINEETAKAPRIHPIVTASDAPAYKPTVIDPLDTAQLEEFMIVKSGLLAARPPLPPAQSGDSFYHAIPFQILSWAPRIVVYPAFIDKARCDHIIALANKMLFPSGLAFAPGEKVDQEQQTRTSKGTFLSEQTDGDGVLAWVEERIAAVTLLPRENGEAFNVLKYENMQHYDSHMDSFDPKTFGPQPSQRIATVLVYLSDVAEGGETVFKKEGLDGGNRVITDWRNCDDGSYTYKPRLGDAVLFWGVYPDGEIDPRSLHGGCPVKNGTKWVMTKWLRSKGGRPAWAQ